MENKFSTIMSSNSVILTMGMPVYNEERYVGEAIESLLAQTYKDFVLVISDNGSIDKTPEICDYYAKRDKRIIFVRQKENRGQLFNFNYVLERAKTPYFMWCGGHDKWHPCFVEKLLPALNEENVIISYPKSRMIDMDGKLGKIYKDDYTTTHINNPADRYFYVLKKMELGNIMHGIWVTKILDYCNLKNRKTIFNDNIVLSQASLEGKFKQHNEILFFPRMNRGEEGYKNMMIRQFVMLSGGKSSKKISTFLLFSSFIINKIKILFYKRYSLNIFTKLWLTINILYIYFLRVYILNFYVKPVLKKILPDRAYSKLKSVRDERKQ